jgi:hypothetical protein
MDRAKLDVLVLGELARRMEAIRRRRKPPRYYTSEYREDSEDRELGPRYTPLWFGELTAEEAGRQAVLRTVYRLAAAGLVQVAKCAGEGRRLERVKLTKAGKEALAELAASKEEVASE